jgi:hypothetical protein
MGKCSLVTLVFKFQIEVLSPTPHESRNPNNYGRALLSVLPQAIASNPHTNLLNVYLQIGNEMHSPPPQKRSKMPNVWVPWSGRILSSDKIFKSHQLKRKSANSAPNTRPASTNIPTTSQFTSRYRQTTGD